MIKKILLIFCVLFAPMAHAAEMVNVEYIHNAIHQRWGITIPYNPALTDPRVAANMEYLLTAVDRANEILNGTSTSYGTSEFATHAAADTVAANTAIDTLIHIKPKFWVTTTADTTVFEFHITSQGGFMVDWGDDTAPEIIVKNDGTGSQRISHEYVTPGVRTIAIGGHATVHNSSSAVAAISFRNNLNVAGIRGSLGAIFSTIGNPTLTWTNLQPRFIYTFSGCRNMAGEIPPELFRGVRGIPVPNMFYETFYSCAKLSGPIPAGLFAGLRGAPQPAMFHYTFLGCYGLTAIPGGLFAGISGKPATAMFKNTFSGCSGLRGEIPRDLFGDISGPATSNMFYATFAGCAGLTGPSAQIGEKYLYEIWPDATTDQVGGCYSSDTDLTDYDQMPYAWQHTS